MKSNNSLLPSLSLKDSVQFIKGVGPKRAELLKRRHIETVEDCLYFLPFRYEDRSQIKAIAELKPREQATFTGEIMDSGLFRARGRRKIYEMVLQDHTGIIRALWYQFNPTYMEKKYPRGKHVILSGKPDMDRRGGARLHIIHPNIELYSEGLDFGIEMGRVVPVYHATEGLHLKSLRSIMHNVLGKYSGLIEEYLPEELIHRHRFPSRQEAFWKVHFPSNSESLKNLQNARSPGHRRLIFDEFFLIQLAMACKCQTRRVQIKGIPLSTRGLTIQKFVRRMQFELTGAQKKVLGEIMDDLERDAPMNRLIQGDVGSGKTVVALITLLTGIDNGFQGALMAPTEILAEQHYLNLKPDCDALGVSVELITSALSPKEKKRVLDSARNGETHLILGTHALIQNDIEFRNLGVVVIDEQHRFGVLQRETLTQKGLRPHTLIMTATPIPRSLALTLYGDLNVSLLDEMPPGRQPIATRVFYGNQREQAYQTVREQIALGRQAYVVCPLIEETEKMDLKTVLEVQKQLQQAFPDLNIGLMHGKMKKEERASIMADFKAGKIHILTATTVIEVGIDVANATLMIVEHAERFGLSQLHQLRGRVGRGEHASHCLLIAYYQLTDHAKARLKVMQESNDGFLVAEEDLNIRGPGDFLGTRQSGIPELKVANLVRDIDILNIARKEAFLLIDRDPHLEKSDHQKLKKEFLRVMSDRMNLMNII